MLGCCWFKERLTTELVAALSRECVELTGNAAVGLTVAKFVCSAVSSMSR